MVHYYMSGRQTSAVLKETVGPLEEIILCSPFVPVCFSQPSGFLSLFSLTGLPVGLWTSLIPTGYHILNCRARSFTVTNPFAIYCTFATYYKSATCCTNFTTLSLSLPIFCLPRPVLLSTGSLPLNTCPLPIF